MFLQVAYIYKFFFLIKINYILKVILRVIEKKENQAANIQRSKILFYRKNALQTCVIPITLNASLFMTFRDVIKYISR